MFRKLATFIPSKAEISLFLGTKYFVDDVRAPGKRSLLSIRLFVQRVWLRRRISSCAKVTVQTTSMEQSFRKTFKTAIPVAVIPMFPRIEKVSRRIGSVVKPKMSRVEDLKLFYPASEEPHKNHKTLIDAMCHLAEEGIKPSLYLTVLSESYLADYLMMANKNYDTRITNLGVMSHEAILEFYRSVDALIFPSTADSFGLPLIEARAQGADIIAAEMDYTRDLVDPEESFDPFSVVSIARSIKRYAGYEEVVSKFYSARSLINWWIN